jgi:hypothetical protein
VSLIKHYIVQLELSCWLAPWKGDPGRTTTLANATRFKSRRLAEQALKQAIEYRAFPNAFVDVLMEVE